MLGSPTIQGSIQAPAPWWSRPRSPWMTGGASVKSPDTGLDVEGHTGRSAPLVQDGFRTVANAATVGHSTIPTLRRPATMVRKPATSVGFPEMSPPTRTFISRRAMVHGSRAWNCGW